MAVTTDGSTTNGSHDEGPGTSRGLRRVSASYRWQGSETPIVGSLSVEDLLAAKNTRPIRSLDDLAADTFESDQELEEFLAFTYAERRRALRILGAD